jgi:hypothetical protein
VSEYPPLGHVNSSFTVVVYLESRAFPYHRIPPPPGAKVLLTEYVYPVAESGPVALVQYKSVFHKPGSPHPRWVVRPGWRTLNANRRVPVELAKLGMLQPLRDSGPATPEPSQAPESEPSKRGADWVTILFVVGALAAVAAVVRRGFVQRRGLPQEQVEKRSETSNLG